MDMIMPGGRAVTLIHYAYPLSDDSPPQYRLACMPNMLPSEFGKTQYHEVHHHTNEPRAATCPACKRTDIFRKAMEKNGVKVDVRKA